MPCTYYTVDEERDMATSRIKKLRDDLDRLTHENDMLREGLLSLANEHENKHGSLDEFGIPASVLILIGKNQTEHRKEDLKRLKKTFTNSRDAEKLGLVMLADPKKPLEPQLGFDPDSY